MDDLKNLVIRSFKIVADGDFYLTDLRTEVTSNTSNPLVIHDLHTTLKKIPRKNEDKFSAKFFAT